jgi:transcription antitermination protein NusB
MGHRRKAREYALQALYMHETVGKNADELTSLAWLDKVISDDIREFTISLIAESIKNIKEIDCLIIKYSRNWSFERLTAIDKSILRLSICAMLYFSEIPIIVTINEGIELGKIYGGENSGQFINGILDAIKNLEINRESFTKGDPNGEK